MKRIYVGKIEEETLDGVMNWLSRVEAEASAATALAPEARVAGELAKALRIVAASVAALSEAVAPDLRDLIDKQSGETK